MSKVDRVTRYLPTEPCRVTAERQDAQREPFFSFRNGPANINIKRTDALGVGLGIIDGPRDGSFQRPRERDIVSCSEGFKRRIWTKPPISKISPWSPLAAHGTAPASGGRDLLRAPQAALPRPKAARCTAQRRSAPCVAAQSSIGVSWERTCCGRLYPRLPGTPLHRTKRGAGAPRPWFYSGSYRTPARSSNGVGQRDHSTSSGEPRCSPARGFSRTPLLLWNQ